MKTASYGVDLQKMTLAGLPCPARASFIDRLVSHLFSLKSLS